MARIDSFGSESNLATPKKEVSAEEETVILPPDPPNDTKS